MTDRNKRFKLPSTDPRFNTSTTSSSDALQFRSDINAGNPQVLPETGGINKPIAQPISSDAVKKALKGDKGAFDYYELYRLSNARYKQQLNEFNTVLPADAPFPKEGETPQFKEPENISFIHDDFFSKILGNNVQTV